MSVRISSVSLPIDEPTITASLYILFKLYNFDFYLSFPEAKFIL